ncbi:MAG: hemerythrin domain-containing protein [Candidatus Binatia bacterium]
MPQKRDPSLIPLSHDHHQGLVRVLQIRLAVRAGQGLDDEVAATRAFWARDLAPHFEAEEAAVFPLMRALPDAADLVLRLVDEHRRLREMAGRLEATAHSLGGFADLLEAHIRLEERDLFVRYQAHVPAAARGAVEAEVRRILNRPDDTVQACEVPRRG